MTAPMPTRPGWWWRRRADGPEPVRVLHRKASGLWFELAGREGMFLVQDDGRWLREVPHQVCPPALGSVALPLEGDGGEAAWDMSPVVGTPRDCDGGAL